MAPHFSAGWKYAWECLKYCRGMRRTEAGNNWLGAVRLMSQEFFEDLLKRVSGFRWKVEWTNRRMNADACLFKVNILYVESTQRIAYYTSDDDNLELYDNLLTNWLTDPDVYYYNLNHTYNPFFYIPIGTHITFPIQMRVIRKMRHNAVKEKNVTVDDTITQCKKIL